MKEKLLARDQIDDKYKWKLEDIYSTDEAWEQDFSDIKNRLVEFTDYKGMLSTSSEMLFRVLSLQSVIKRKLDDVKVYALLKSDEDSSLSIYQDMRSRAENLFIEVSAAQSYIVPEILSMEEEQIEKFIDEEEGLSIYRRYLKDIMRKKSHVLSQKEEELLSMAKVLAKAPERIFSMINDVEMKFPCIKNEEGKDIELTKANSFVLLMSNDRNVRKATYENVYGTYHKKRHTFAVALSANVEANIFFAKARKFNSALELALSEENINIDIYDSLLQAVHNRIDLLHRYMGLRKKILGYDKLNMYDIQVPIVSGGNLEITYNDAKKTFIKALNCLGEDYLRDFQKGLDSGWIDPFESKGKCSVPYSTATYNSHPYILINYNNTMKSASTLIHEMGHAMHYYYSNKNQHYVNSRFSIFVAEVVGILNESLFVSYLVNTSVDKAQKLQYINHYLEQFRVFVYSTTLFAEFEKLIHEKAEKGESLTADVFCDIYGKLNKFYYGDDVITDEYISVEWSRLPHFYSSFYVYKYATGFSAANALAKDIIDGKEGALERYRDLLRSGGNDYPFEQLKKAGVDISNTKPIEQALDVFEELLDEFERLI